MKPSQFHYHAPSTIDEVVALLARLEPEGGRILAGGQSLVPMMNLRLAAPEHLIDINGVVGLDQMREEGGKLIIPACVRHADIERNAGGDPLGRLLRLVANHIGHTPIRARGTFCGSLANADPASEWCLVAATLDAEMHAHCINGVRAIQAGEFFSGVMSTALAGDEFLAEVRLPVLSNDTHFGFYEVCRRAGDFALAMSLVLWGFEDGKIISPRIGIGGVESKPRRISEAEAVLEGRAPSEENFKLAADVAVEALDDVLEDARIGAAYRRDIIRTVVLRALERSAS